ncbi:hypothetical protein RUM43_008096 [Polyplax serrata]|uniref:Transmembrane protein n=1 Tax=Polyplax serrata TaxID=468196 RepID=A0AAN8PE98_POLSC
MRKRKCRNGYSDYPSGYPQWSEKSTGDGDAGGGGGYVGDDIISVDMFYYAITLHILYVYVVLHAVDNKVGCKECSAGMKSFNLLLVELS